MQSSPRNTLCTTDAYLTSDQLDPPLGVKLDGLRINPVLLSQYPVGKRFLRVVIKDRNQGLNDDGSRVDTFIGKMDRTARKLNTVFKGPPLGMYSLKGRQQGGVYVHNPHGKCIEKHRCQNTHETGHDNQFNVMVSQDLDHLLIEGLAASELPMIDDNSGDTVFLDTLQRVGFGVVADDDLNAGIQTVILDTINDGLKIRATAGDKDAEINNFSH